LDRSLRNEGWQKDSNTGLEYKCEKDYVESLDEVELGEVKSIANIEVDEINLHNDSNTLEFDLNINTKHVLDYISNCEHQYKPKLKNKHKTALVFGDLHFNLQSDECVSILNQIASEYEFDEVISAGDGVDFGELSTFDYLEDIGNNFREEKLNYEAFMFNLKKLQPSAKFIELYSNHFDDRAFRVSRQGDFKKFGMEKLAYESFTNLNFPFDYRTIAAMEKYYPFEQNRIGFIHGIKHSDQVAKSTGLAMGNGDVCFFHTHTCQTYTYSNERPDRNANKFYGLPCMCKKDLKYRRNNPSRWVNGFVVLNYYEETDYYTIEYVIVENGMAIYRGKTYESDVQ